MMAAEDRATMTTPFFLGIDLGGTKILTVVATAEGRILSRDHSLTPAEKGPEGVINAILASVDRVLTQAGMRMNGISAIGIDAPGLVDPESGVVFTSPNLPGWLDVPLRDAVQGKLGKPSFLINDARAATLGEYRFGAGRGVRHLIYVTISTGIGGGTIIDGNIYFGASGLAGEVGHMTIDDHGPLCPCGNTGCWETLASGTALTREARRLAEEKDGATILQIAGGKVERVTAETVHAAALKDDPGAKKLISQTAHYIGIGLANLINIFNPEAIVIGGGLTNMGDMLLKPALETAGNRAFRRMFQTVRFSTAGLGRNSGVLGAIEFARQRTSSESGAQSRGT